MGSRSADGKKRAIVVRETVDISRKMLDLPDSATEEQVTAELHRRAAASPLALAGLPDKHRRVTVSEDEWLELRGLANRARALCGLPEAATSDQVMDALRGLGREGTGVVVCAPVAEPPAVDAKPARRRLPDERRSVVRKMHLPPSPPKAYTCPKCDATFEIQRPPLKIYVTVGFYEDGTVGEVFIRADKAGSFVSGVLDGLAIAISLALQHGTDPLAIARQYVATKFSPAGVTGDPRYPIVNSFLDYFGRWLRDLVRPAEAPALVAPDPAGEGDIP